MEVIKEEEVTSKDFGLVVYEMLALHSPHVDKLVVPGSDEEDGNVDEMLFWSHLIHS